MFHGAAALLILVVVGLQVSGEVVSRASNPIQKTTVYGCGYDRILQVQICLICDTSACGIYRIAFRSTPVGVRTDIPISPSVNTFVVRSTRRLAYVYYSNNSLIQYNMDNWLAAPLDTGFSFDTTGTHTHTCTACTPTATCTVTYNVQQLTVGDDNVAYGVAASCTQTLIVVQYAVPLPGSTTGGSTTYQSINTNQEVATVRTLVAYHDASNQRLYVVMSGGTTCPLLYQQLMPSVSTILCRSLTCPSGSGTISNFGSTFDALHDRMITTLGSCNVVASVASSTMKVLAGTGATGYLDGYAQFEAIVETPQAPSVSGRQIFFFSQSETSGYIVARVFGATSTQSRSPTLSFTSTWTPEKTRSKTASVSKSLTRSRTTSFSVSRGTPTPSVSSEETDSATFTTSRSREKTQSLSPTQSADTTLSPSPTVSSTQNSPSTDTSESISSSASEALSKRSSSLSPERTSSPSRTASHRGQSKSLHQTTPATATLTWSAETTLTSTITRTWTPSSDSTVSATPSAATLSASQETRSPSSSKTVSPERSLSTTSSGSFVASRSLTVSASGSLLMSSSISASLTSSVTPSITLTASFSPSLTKFTSLSHATPTITASPTKRFSTSRSTTCSGGSVSRSATRSHVMSTARGVASASLSISITLSSSPASPTSSNLTSFTATMPLLSQTHHLSSTAPLLSVTPTLFVIDNTDKRPFYIVLGVAAALAGGAVVGGIILGLVKIYGAQSAHFVAPEATPVASEAAVGSTTVPAAPKATPPVPTMSRMPVVGIPRSIATQPVFEKHYEAPIVRQEVSTRRLRAPDVDHEDDDIPWWASAAAPPPVRVPPTAHTHNDSIVIDVDEHDEPFYVVSSNTNNIIDPSSPAAYESVDDEPLWFDEVELSPS